MKTEAAHSLAQRLCRLLTQIAWGVSLETLHFVVVCSYTGAVTDLSTEKNKWKEEALRRASISDRGGAVDGVDGRSHVCTYVML